MSKILCVALLILAQTVRPSDSAGSQAGPARDESHHPGFFKHRIAVPKSRSPDQSSPAINKAETDVVNATLPPGHAHYKKSAKVTSKQHQPKPSVHFSYEGGETEYTTKYKPTIGVKRVAVPKNNNHNVNGTFTSSRTAATTHASSTSISNSSIGTSTSTLAPEDLDERSGLTESPSISGENATIAVIATASTTAAVQQVSSKTTQTATTSE